MAKDKDIFIEGENIENLFSDDLHPFLKWGMTWLFVVGIALFTLTYFMRWPEVVKASAVLTSSESPKAMIPKIQGKINGLFFANGQEVSQGDLLITIGNTADQTEVSQLLTLIDLVDTLYQYRVEEVADIPLDYFQLSNLGELQQSYEQFSRSFSELKFALSDEYLQSKLSLIYQRASSLRKMNVNLRLQRNTMYTDYENAVARYEKENLLYEKGSITGYELKDYEGVMLNKRLSFQNTKNAIIQNEGQQQDLLEQKIQLTQSIEQQKNNFVQAFKTLKSTCGQWQANYEIRSPIDGLVSVPSGTEVDAVVSPQAPAMYILPIGADAIVQIRLSQNNLQAIDTGKEVRIRLTAYPYEDFGVLEGSILRIADIPTEGEYEAIVKLNKCLNTSFDKKIDFINGLSGEAEVILDDERLMIRLFRKLLKS